MKSSSYIATIAIIMAAVLFGIKVRAAMQSSNYAIPTDSVNFGGGAGASANFSEQDTIGEVGTGPSSSANYALQAGYQQVSGSSISLSSVANVTLPNLGGVSAGSSLASSTWNVTTDDAAGYQLTIVSATASALQSPAHAFFGDYLPAGGSSAADFTFTTPGGSSLFGFSPEGPDITSRWKDNGSACGTGSSDTFLACWAGFLTSAQTIAQGASANQPSGASTTVEYEAAVGANKIQDAGTYTATLTVTAVAL